MKQSQEEIRRIIISDMVKKRNSIVSDFTLTSFDDFMELFICSNKF